MHSTVGETLKLSLLSVWHLYESDAILRCELTADAAINISNRCCCHIERRVMVRRVFEDALELHLTEEGDVCIIHVSSTLVSSDAGFHTVTSH